MTDLLKRYRAMERAAVGAFAWYFPASRDLARDEDTTVEDALSRRQGWPDGRDALLFQGWPQRRYVLPWYGENQQ